MHNLRQRQRKASAVIRNRLQPVIYPGKQHTLRIFPGFLMKPGSGEISPHPSRSPSRRQHTARRGFLTACRAEPPPRPWDLPAVYLRATHYGFRLNLLNQADVSG